jgi:hypothetical protein
MSHKHSADNQATGRAHLVVQACPVDLLFNGRFLVISRVSGRRGTACLGGQSHGSFFYATCSDQAAEGGSCKDKDLVLLLKGAEVIEGARRDPRKIQQENRGASY